MCPRVKNGLATGHALIQVILIFVTQVDWQFKILIIMMMMILIQQSQKMLIFQPDL